VRATILGDVVNQRRGLNGCCKKKGHEKLQMKTASKRGCFEVLLLTSF
jgi:hypothetical protein